MHYCLLKKLALNISRNHSLNPDDVKSRYFDDTGTIIASLIGFLGIGFGILIFIPLIFFDLDGDLKLFGIGVVISAI